jgi:hypothetical protein
MTAAEGRSRLRLISILLAVVTGALILGLAITWIPQRLVDAGEERADGKPGLSANEQVISENAVRLTLVQAFGGLLLLVGATFTLRQLRISRDQLQATLAQHELNSELSRASLDASRSAQNNEAWTRAVDQFGSESLPTRLGGIASLEKIAATDVSMLDVVMEILTAYIRQNAPKHNEADDDSSEGWWGEPSTRPSVDVQLALRVLGRLRNDEPPLDELMKVTDHKLLDFESCNLRGANLTLGHFEGSMFHRADLSEANLSGGFFEKAVFFRGRGARANFAGNFSGASFDECDLESADFHRADLFGATFVGANLIGAKFGGANLCEANFGAAKFDSETQLSGAIADANTKWPDGFDFRASGVRMIEAPEGAEKPDVRD